LLLNPAFNNDNIILDITARLSKNNIIDLFTSFKYYNYNYNLFELVLLGKLRIDAGTNELVFVRFFNLQAVLNFVNKLNIAFLYNSELVNHFKELKKNDYIDKDYIHTIMDLYNIK